MTQKLNKDLIVLLSGQLISQIGDKFYLLALSFWVLDSTGSAALMGIVLFASTIPEVLVGLFAGALVDRFSRKWMIVVTDLIRGIIVLVVAVIAFTENLTLPIIIVSQVLLSINTAFFNPASPAIIPQLVEQDSLAKANSQTQLVRGISLVVGPVLGGISVGLFGFAVVFLINALSFLLSGLFEILIANPESSINSSDAEDSFIESVKEGFHTVLKNNELIILLASIAVIHFFVGAFQVILPVMAEILNGDGPENLGYLQTSFGSGMLLIGFILSSLNIIDKRERKMLMASVFLMGIINVLAGVLMSNDQLNVLYYPSIFCLLGGAIIIAVTSFRTLVQKSVPNRLAGRVFGVAFAVSDASLPLAMLIFGFLLEVFQVSYLLLLCGSALMVFSLLFIIPQKQVTLVKS